LDWSLLLHEIEVCIMGDAEQKRDRERKRKASLWRMKRVKKRIEEGYYDRPDVRREIVDALLEAFLGRGRRRRGP